MLFQALLFAPDLPGWHAFRSYARQTRTQHKHKFPVAKICVGSMLFGGINKLSKRAWSFRTSERSGWLSLVSFYEARREKKKELHVSCARVSNDLLIEGLPMTFRAVKRKSFARASALKPKLGRALYMHTATS